MKLRRRAEKALPEKVEKRVAQLSATDFPQWIEQCLCQVGRSVSDYGKTGEWHHLEEAEMAATTLDILVREYKRRST